MTDLLAALISSMPMPAPGLPDAVTLIPSATPDRPEGQKIADFSAVLAAMPTSSVAAIAIGADAEGEASPPPAKEPIEIEPAAALPDGGKLLPPPLPVALPHSVRASSSTETESGRDEPASDRPAAQPAVQAEPVAIMLPMPIIAPISGPTPPSAEPFAATAPLTPPRPRPVAVATPDKPAAAKDAPATNPLPATAAAAVTIVASEPPRTERTLALRLRPVAVPPDRSPHGIPQITAITPTMVFEPLRTPDTMATPIAFAAPAPLPAGSAPVAQGPASPVVAHDFAALVDRLSAAREAVQPHPVSLAIAHAEFGPVRIDFRSEDGALNATLASADPDFARAVAAAPAIQPVAPPTDTAPAQGRGTEGRQNDTGGQPPRGQAQPERRDERAPRSNPAPHHQNRGSDRDQSGIFA